MLYLLSEFSNHFGPLRLFEYVTFRAGGAAATSFLAVLLLGGWFARLLRRLNTQAASRYADLFPAEWVDKEKERTPCMGGVLIIGTVAVTSILWTEILNPIALVLVVGTVAFAAIGFIDDYLKVFKKNRDGIPGKVKLLGQFGVAALAVWFLNALPVTGPYMQDLMIPFMKAPVYHGIWVLPFAVIVIVGASNAVNLTDGKDGLATGCTIFCMLTYAVFAYMMGHRIFAGYLSIPYIIGISEAVVFIAAVTGACIGFLWHNCHPASMFMGDTGSLALGGAVGMLAVLTRQELLLLLVGGVFVMEAMSVILQVGYFKLTKGKRIFLCTPIHHHFERKNWTETQIVVRFWILSGVFALIALSSLKLR